MSSDAKQPSTSSHSLHAWLTAAVEREASDLHLAAGYPPVLRVHGKLWPLNEPALDGAALRELLEPLPPSGAFARFLAGKNLDFSFDAAIGDTQRRFRANFFFSGGAIGACFRVIPEAIPSFEWAGFPRELAQRLAHFRNGLVLFSGVAGSGKSTTLAMIINLLNQDGGCRIVTAEEPVEYRFEQYAGSLVTQREVGQDVDSFADGLKYALRQDPDVILVGEIRDRDTAQMALSAAETGHLVFSTLHTRDAKGAVSRYADLFPQDVQTEVRAQLAMSLRAVVSQHLLPSIVVNDKRVLALEVMFNNSPIASAIRFGKLESIDNSILTGKSAGMITLDDSLKRLVASGQIDSETAASFAAGIAVRR